MRPNDSQMQNCLEHFRKTLRQAGIKLTHQRREIFREIVRSVDHPDVETIYRGVRRKLTTISLDTVYRTLWLFLDLGLIATLGLAHHRTRFDANLTSHHHFVCTKCGLIRDFSSRQFDQLNIPPSAKTFGPVESTHVEVLGVCRQCAGKKLKPKTHKKKGIKS